MTTQIQFRRGTTSQHGSFTGALGEITVDTDKDVVVVHDGSTAGGHPMSRLTDIVNDTTPQLGAALDTNAFYVDFDDARGIRDDAANQQLIFQKTSSAANHFEMTNAAAGNNPSLAAVGDSTNISLNLIAKGTGVVQAGGNQIANLATAQEYTKAQNFNATTLTDAAPVVWDSSANQVCSVTIAANRALSAPSNLVDGTFLALTIIQDSTGSRTVTWNSVFKWAGGAAPTLTTAGNSRDYFVFRTNGTNLYEQGRTLDVK